MQWDKSVVQAYLNLSSGLGNMVRSNNQNDNNNDTEEEEEKEEEKMTKERSVG